MPDELRNRTVLITGASRGLGEALAIVFARAGAKLTLCARSSIELVQVASAARETGATCLEMAVDVRETEAVDRWVRAAEESLGPADVLINNASLLGPREPLAAYDETTWRAVIDVNLTGAFLVTRAVLPGMLARGSGSIVNVSSGAARPPRREWGAYAVSKAALEAFTINLAAELEGSGVRVNSVDPGAMRTAMRAQAYPAEDAATVKVPAAATGVFLWLASDAAREISGQRFRADEWRAG